VRVAIYDPRGRLVRSLVDAPLEPGNHVLRWDGRDGRGHALGSGVYFYEVRAGDERVAGKLTLIR
jgi:flagellar hook assembly protein FlgD